ncbi:MAG: DUF3429 domain-containing protein [Pseudomonadota bacterium]
MDSLTERESSLTPTARLLGYAGLLPQIICVGLVASGSEYRFTALFMGFVYPAIIFSFLGGVWWGQSLARPGHAGAFVNVLAVLPSLIAAALFMPYQYGWEWPGPALFYLGALLALSPMIDRALGFAAKDFLQLRWHLSLGLGGLSIALGVLGTQAMAIPNHSTVVPADHAPQSGSEVVLKEAPRHGG